MQDYMAALKEQFPGVDVTPMPQHFSTSALWVRVEAPESILLDVVDATSSLSYTWLVDRGVDILASVVGIDEEEPSIPSGGAAER